nr:hypothetical protein BaRGS_006797 [Batillaria attramentaria]
MVNIKLYYFSSFAGRGELCRLLLAASGVDWEDVRFTHEEWVAKYKAESPFGQCPYLEYEGKKYAQTVAICNFLARKYGFGGKTDLQWLRIDEIEQLVQELMACTVRQFYEQDKEKKAHLLEKLKNEDVPKYLTIFERMLKENGTGLFVGDQLTMADMAVYDVINNTIKGLYKFTDVDKDYPLVRGVFAKVEAHPNIRRYLETQRRTGKNWF